VRCISNLPGTSQPASPAPAAPAAEAPAVGQQQQQLLHAHPLDLSSSTVASSVYSREGSPARERHELVYLHAPGMAAGAGRSSNLRLAALRGAAGLALDAADLSGLIVPMSSDGEDDS
jgi:hypothetical protein